MARRFNITVKMLGYLLVASIVPLVLLGVTAFDLSKRIVISQAEAENARLVGSFSAYLRLYNDQVEDMAANIAGNASIGQALRRADARTSSGFESLETRAQMGYILNSYVRVRGLVSIDLFSLRGEHFHVGETLSVDTVAKDRYAALLKEAVVAKAPTRWRGIDENLNRSSQQKQVISVVRAIQHFSPLTGKSDVVGLLVISLNDEITRSFLDGVALAPGTQLLQLDRNGRIALHSDASQFGRSMTPALLQLIRSTPAVPQLTLDGEDMLMNVTPYDEQERMVVVLSPRRALTEKVNQLALATALLVGLGLLIILALVWHFERTMVQPIRAVSGGFGRIKRQPNREHSALPQHPSQDEIGQLVQGYNEHLLALQSQREATDSLQRSEAVLRATEIQLRDSEARVREILDEMPVGVFLVNAQDQIFLRNRHFVKMFGYLEPEVPDMATWWKVAHPDPQYRRQAQKTLNAMRHTTADGRTAWSPRVYTMHCKSGEVLHVEVAGVSTASGYICTFVDYTEHQQHQMQLESAKQQAELANQAKSAFLATMSHEIRTPMNGILGMLKLLEYTGLNARQNDYTQKAQAATQALLGIINDILDFSKVEAGKMSLEIQAFSLGQVMRDLSTLLSASQSNQSVEVLFDVSADVPDGLAGDAMRLGQVLLNLSANAIKFTQHGQVVVRIRAVERNASDVTLEFSVSDTGIGIAADKLAYIFEGFSQAESSTTRRFGGTGLGLAICKRLVALMGGELCVTSTLGQGSRFSFVVNMPVAQDFIASNAIENIVTPAVGPAYSQPLAGLRLLVVEDNPLNQQIARELLIRQGASVQVAGGGLSGVRDALQADPPFDAVLMDLQMPDIDGLEATRRIRAHSHMGAVPIIAMTANAMESDKAQCRAVGMVDHVSKPVDLEQLIAVLLRHTGRSSSAMPAQEAQRQQAPSAPQDSGLVIDIDTAVARMGGNRDIYNMVAGAFCADVPVQLDAFRAAVHASQWADAARHAHTLKGLAGTVGAVQLVTHTVQAEALLKSAAQDGRMEPDETSNLLESLGQSLQKACAALQALLPTSVASQQGAEAPLTESARRELLESLQSLSSLLADNNMQSTLLSAEVRQRFGDAAGESLVQLDTLVQQLSFESALAKCELLSQSLVGLIAYDNA